MMYYLAWLLLMMVGLTVSVLLFVWAFYTGQFSDQKRAGYLPLVGETRAAPASKGMGKERYALFVLLAGAGGVFIATLVVALATGR